MNWYKKNQKTELEYEDIGHSNYEQPEYEDKLNKIWIYYEGELLIGEETDLTPTHTDVFPFIFNQERFYRGRYNPKTEQLSLMIPFKARFNGVPKKLIYLLSRKFNDPIIKIFSEKKNWYKIAYISDMSQQFDKHTMEKTPDTNTFLSGLKNTIDNWLSRYGRLYFGSMNIPRNPKYFNILRWLGYSPKNLPTYFDVPFSYIEG